jgi:hypothetical protein
VFKSNCLINQENEPVRISLIEVKIEFVNSQLSTFQCFDHNFRLNDRMEMKLADDCIERRMENVYR